MKKGREKKSRGNKGEEKRRDGGELNGKTKY